MLKIRLSKIDDIPYLKEMWKSCFGDEDEYIEFFFDHQYKPNQTFLSLYNGKIVSMLTMFPTQVVTPDQQHYPSVMLYAIGTHPHYQGKGFSTQIMDYTWKYLQKHKVNISVLVPAENSLFAFYHKRGYEAGFYIREVLLTDQQIEKFKLYQEDMILPMDISSIGPSDYNKRRNQQLKGRLYMAYDDEKIAYQKKLSQLSGADIYGINIGIFKGCATVERIHEDKVMIKEFLLPEHQFYRGLVELMKVVSAKEYILRLPADVGESLGGSVRAFGMIQFEKEFYKKTFEENMGYLGIAYD